MPLTKSEAERLIREQGGEFVRNGGRHDIWLVNGRFVQIPRHPGDLSPGVERKIRNVLNAGPHTD